MRKPEITENFTVEDIHAIRQYNAEKRSKMSKKERLADIKIKADECEKDIKKYRKKGMAI